MKKKTLMMMLLLVILIWIPMEVKGGTSSTTVTSTQEVTGESGEILNILIINAYHIEYQWTYNQYQGMKTEIQKTYPQANIFTEFLDWKRFPDPQLILDQAQVYQDKYKDVKIDLILTTDDKALEFAMTYRQDLFDNAPIVFGGILDTTAKDIIGDQKNITGVYEKMKPEGTIELLRTLQPTVNKLVVIHDLSESGLRTNNSFLAALTKLNLENEYEVSDWSDRSYEEILEGLPNLEADTAVIFISYAISSDGVVKTPQAFCSEFSEASSVPMYSVDEHQFGYGITGGTFLSGVLQGEAMGELGVRILKGESADSIPHVSQATVYTGVDETYLKKYGLDKGLLASDVVILHEEKSFYEQNTMLVNATLAVLGVLLISIIILLWFQTRLKKSRALIMASKNELQYLNDELQVGREELIAQNEELEEMKNSLEYENRHDFLTGLFNRNALEEYLNQQLTNMGPESKAVVLFLDLDNFKFINNTYGHRFGDKLLIRVAKRLELVEEGMYVSRIGGDEFVLVKTYEDSQELSDFKSLLLRIGKSINTEFIIDEQQVSISASIGYSLYPDNGKTFEQLLVEADVAMYNAKKSGKSALKKYVDGMNDIYQNEYLLIRKVKEALEKSEFYMQYQPIVNCDGSKVVSFEALVRWNDKELGAVAPAKFIPVAETSGLILPLGEFICKNVMEFYQRLRNQGIHHVKLSINVSIVQFYQGNFVQNLMQMTKLNNVDPRDIQLEITESVMIEAYDYIVEKLNELKEYGFHIALDDFGTGFSSLSYLQKLPLDVIKIDKSFMDQITDYRGSTLVDATISLAKQFGLKTIAEGVETKEQVDYLANTSCDLIQGYYYSRPLMPEDAITYALQRM